MSDSSRYSFPGKSRDTTNLSKRARAAFHAGLDPFLRWSFGFASILASGKDAISLIQPDRSLCRISSYLESREFRISEESGLNSDKWHLRKKSSTFPLMELKAAR